VSFAHAAFGDAAAADLPAMAPMQVGRAMLGGCSFALTFTLGFAFGLAFDFQRIVDRLFCDVRVAADAVRGRRSGPGY
jgi:hypothetical protein